MDLWEENVTSSGGKTEMLIEGPVDKQFEQIGLPVTILPFMKKMHLIQWQHGIPNVQQPVLLNHKEKSFQ